MSRVCTIPQIDDAPPLEKCGTTKGPKGYTLCEGDRVVRLPVKEGKKVHKFPNKGTVLGVQMGRDNSGKKMLGARVCFDHAKPGDTAYKFLFVELKKAK